MTPSLRTLVDRVLVLQRPYAPAPHAAFLLRECLPDGSDQKGDDSPEWAEVRHGTGLIVALPLGLLTWAVLLTSIWLLV